MMSAIGQTLKGLRGHIGRNGSENTVPSIL